MSGFSIRKFKDCIQENDLNSDESRKLDWIEEL